MVGADLPEAAGGDDIPREGVQAPDEQSGRPRPLSVNPDTLPPSQRASLIHAQMEFSGPLPPPQILGQYDEVLPGAAERILRMAEKQQDHRSWGGPERHPPR